MHTSNVVTPIISRNLHHNINDTTQGVGGEAFFLKETHLLYVSMYMCDENRTSACS